MNYSETLEEESKLTIEKFIGDTFGESVLQIVLRGHLYIENGIEKLLRCALVKPDVIINDRFMFINKLNLAVAMDLIPQEVSVTLRYLNSKIRNKYAHNLEFEMTQKHLDDLISKFDKDTKKFYERAPYLKMINAIEDNFIEKVRSALWALWFRIKSLEFEYRIRPFNEEINELTRMLQFKNNPEGEAYIESRHKEIIQRIKREISSISSLDQR
ncbi:hypothetical protein [Priestia aryabhattai]|uniref:hypothetical protein n=1 Tax=Priestia aryabhattai TaxID=412384 RepID=UPI00203A4F49|nr:hypothetical protein [Priestia aryabhattai]MCM3255561.1 hypothetical protein [Priestia aryabhattai]